MATNDLRYPNHYVWLVFVSTLDLMMTYTILYLGGREVNPVAQAVLSHYGFIGMTLFKFSLVVFVIVMCEAVGRRDHIKGRRLAVTLVALSALPSVVALAQLAMYQSRLA